MKIRISLLMIILVYACNGTINNNPVSSENKKKAIAMTYNIILKTYNPEPMGDEDSIEIPGSIDTIALKKLSEPLKGLTAFYSAMGGSYCDGTNCELTTALGLGKQGSGLHKNLIKKYFPTDTVAELLIKQDCYLRPDGASTFNSYEYLKIITLGDTIKVDYDLWNYEHGETKENKECDIYFYNNGIFKKIKRNDDGWTK